MRLHNWITRNFGMIVSYRQVIVSFVPSLCAQWLKKLRKQGLKNIETFYIRNVAIRVGLLAYLLPGENVWPKAKRGALRKLTNQLSILNHLHLIIFRCVQSMSQQYGQLFVSNLDPACIRFSNSFNIAQIGQFQILTPSYFITVRFEEKKKAGIYFPVVIRLSYPGRTCKKKFG